MFDQEVKRWVRNVVGMFGLPTATGTFYHDFFAGLLDGRVLLTEYKVSCNIQKRTPG